MLFNHGSDTSCQVHVIVSPADGPAPPSNAHTHRPAASAEGVQRPFCDQKCLHADHMPSALTASLPCWCASLCVYMCVRAGVDDAVLHCFSKPNAQSILTPTAGSVCCRRLLIEAKQLDSEEILCSASIMPRPCPCVCARARACKHLCIVQLLYKAPSPLLLRRLLLLFFHHQLL